MGDTVPAGASRYKYLMPVAAVTLLLAPFALLVVLAVLLSQASNPPGDVIMTRQGPWQPSVHPHWAGGTVVTRYFLYGNRLLPADAENEEYRHPLAAPGFHIYWIGVELDEALNPFDRVQVPVDFDTWRNTQLGARFEVYVQCEQPQASGLREIE